MTEDAIPAGTLAAAFLKIRDKRAELKRVFEEQDKELEAQMDVLEAEMLEKCKVENADSIKTPEGTIMRSVKARFWPADWDAFNNYVLQNQALGLLEKRVHQTNMAHWL